MCKLQTADLTQIMTTAGKGVTVFKEYKPETDEETKEEEGATAQRAPEPGNIYFYRPPLREVSDFVGVF